MSVTATIADSLSVGKKLRVTLVLRGPILTQSSVSGPWGVDAVCARNADGQLYLPGSLVRGKVRESFEQLGLDPFQRSRSLDMGDYLAQGEANDARADALRDRSRRQLELDRPRRVYDMTFSDFVAEGDWPEAGIHSLTRVTMDPSTRAAKKGGLRTLDCPVLPGQPIRFTGSVYYLSRGTETGVESALQRALGWITSFGSDQSVGYGRLISTELESADVALDFVDSGDFKTADVDFTFEDYLCFPNGVVNGNVYESDRVISGAVIKGAMAAAIKDFLSLKPAADIVAEGEDNRHLGLLCKYFNSLVVTNAVPCRIGTQKLLTQAPLSLVSDGKDGFIDLATYHDLAEPLVAGKAIAFQTDWKGETHQAYEKRLGLDHARDFPRQELRVRTAVDTAKGRSHDGKLFAYRGYSPSGFSWRCSVTLSDPCNQVEAEQRQALGRQLRAVLQSGWMQFGKTKTRGSGKVINKQLAELPPPSQVDGHNGFVVRLLGDALMLDPREIEAGSGRLSPSLERVDSMYGDYWHDVSNGILRHLPARRFAANTLVGGYQAFRFRYQLPPKSGGSATAPYNPTLLTSAGSVFVLVFDESDRTAVETLLTSWLRYGLPIPPWAADAYGNTFATNPFLPENGYGQIAVGATNLQKLQPSCTEIPE